jgi:DNA-binding transcriptional LysR family regulator
LHIIAVASPDYLKGRTLPSDPSGLAAFDGIVMRSMHTGRVKERIMRNATGDEMEVPQKATLAFDDPEAMCRAALLSLGVTLIAVPHALPHLETGTLVRILPQWYSDAGPISIYYATRTLLPAKTRVFVDFVAEAFRHNRLVVLSQKAAVRFDKNQLSGEIHGSMRGLRWIIDEQMTVNRGLRPMSRGL